MAERSGTLGGIEWFEDESRNVLYQFAKEQGVEGIHSRSKKSEIVDALEAASNKAAPPVPEPTPAVVAPPVREPTPAVVAPPAPAASPAPAPAPPVAARSTIHPLGVNRRGSRIRRRR